MTFKIPEKAAAELAADPEAEGRRLKEEAMDRVYVAADPAVKADMKRAVKLVASRQHEFNADDVWAEVMLRPEEPRVLGPIMRWAAQQGICEKTERHVVSKLPQNHQRDILVWRSLTFGEQAEQAAAVAPAAFNYLTQGLIGQGHAGFVCSDCRCPVDYLVRGPHERGCANASYNESLLPGAEQWANHDAETYEAGKKEAVKP